MPIQDFQRLAGAIQARATALGLSQQDLVSRSGLSRTTVQKLWQGDDTYAPSRRTRVAIEDALDWAPGSVEAVLAGGEPTVRREASVETETIASDSPAAARSLTTVTDMPLRVQLALGEGRPLDFDVLEFEVGGRRMSIVAWAQSGVYDTEEDREAALEQLKMFHRLMGTLRREGEGVTDDTSAASDR
jgi:transcriptional regulator with XRE-family HTH domain